MCAPGELNDAEEFINFLRKNKCLNKYKSLISAVFWDEKKPDFKSFFEWLLELELASEYHDSDVELTEELVFIHLVKTYLFNNYDYFINSPKCVVQTEPIEITRHIFEAYYEEYSLIENFCYENQKLILNNPEKLFSKFTKQCLEDLFGFLSLNMGICKLALDENKLKRKKFFKKSLIAYNSIKRFHKLLYKDLVDFTKSKSVCSNPSDLI